MCRMCPAWFYCRNILVFCTCSQDTVFGRSSVCCPAPGSQRVLFSLLPVTSSCLPRISLKWLQPGLCEGGLEPAWREPEGSLDFLSRAAGTVEESSVLGRDGASRCASQPEPSLAVHRGHVLRRLRSPRELLLSCISIKGPKIDDPGRMSGAHLLKGRAWQARVEPGLSKG